MEPPVRVAVPAQYDAVVQWAAQQPGRCLVTDAGEGWTFVDLDSAGPEGAVARFEGPVYEVDPDGDVWLHHAGAEPQALPLYVDDPDDPAEVAAFEQAWSLAPPGLAETDPRLEPPVAAQVVLARRSDDRDLAATALGLAADVVHVGGPGWALVGPSLRPSATLLAGDVEVVAAGLTANGGRALVLTAGRELAEVVLWRSGRPRSSHVWNLRRELVGAAVQPGDSGQSSGLPEVTVDELAGALGSTADGAHSLVRAVLRRNGDPVRLLVELVEQLAPRVDTALLADVLAGRRWLDDDARAVVVRAPASFVAFLRSSWSASPPLDPARLPWYALACTAVLPVGVVLVPLRLWQLVHGDIDAWGVAQLVGWTPGLPFALWQAARVRRWLSGRRHSMRK